jgi:hypothetical protein
VEIHAGALSFRDRFCRLYGCADADYEVAALKRFLCSPWSLIAPILCRIAPNLISTDIRIIKQLGLVESRVNFSAEVKDLRIEYVRKRDFGFFRRSLRLRLSRQRILSASKRLWTKSRE